MRAAPNTFFALVAASLVLLGCVPEKTPVTYAPFPEITGEPMEAVAARRALIDFMEKIATETGRVAIAEMKAGEVDILLDPHRVEYLGTRRTYLGNELRKAAIIYVPEDATIAAFVEQVMDQNTGEIAERTYRAQFNDITVCAGTIETDPAGNKIWKDEVPDEQQCIRNRSIWAKNHKRVEEMLRTMTAMFPHVGIVGK